ncbi:MAG: hybrid sensor histidine kinase/response regulator [Rubrivivax sp.]
MDGLLSAGAPALPGPARLDAADRMRVMVLQTPSVLVGNALGVTLVAAIFWEAAGAPLVLGWVAVAAALWGMRLAHWWRGRGLGEAEVAAMLGWRVRWRVLVVAMGAAWGLAVWIFWDSGQPHQRLLLILIVYSYCLGSVQLLSTQPRVFAAFVAVVLLPTIARVGLDAAQPWHWQLAGVLALLFGITLLMGRTHGDALARTLWLKARTETLAAQLQAEKAQAEAARRQAEEASRAKTQFLAAASHDLRQPLHAMGLFAEALRERVHEPALADLVGSIHDSVDALQGLFSELLDITRIDAGGVELDPIPVRLDELYARLRLSFEAAALEKGLALRLHGGHHVVRADPLALERILRNLVSNALRYTDAGGVLVSCRRRGQALLLQVWDSGIGVPEASLPRLFDEFYQAHPQRPVGPRQRKGLGLGLAIVRRLAELSGTQVEVRSRPGHGSVFSFVLPRARATAWPPGAPAAAAREPARLAQALRGRHVVVVDDDAPVRQGLQALLQTWGAAVSAFDSLEAVQAWLRAGGAQRPDLLIVDHRLPADATGAQVVQALRAAFMAPELPAILVTGSMLEAPELARAGTVPGLPLLLKPVLPARLRALVEHLLPPLSG